MLDAPLLAKLDECIRTWDSLRRSQSTPKPKKVFEILREIRQDREHATMPVDELASVKRVSTPTQLTHSPAQRKKFDAMKFKRIPHISQVRINKMADFNACAPDVVGRVIALIDNGSTDRHRKVTLRFRNHLVDADEKEILYILTLIARNSPHKIEKLNSKINEQYNPGRTNSVNI